jgi:hypothetical protein
MKQLADRVITVTCDHGDKKPIMNGAYRVDGEWRWRRVDEDLKDGFVHIKCRRGCNFTLITTDEKMGAFLDRIAETEVKALTLQQIAPRVAVSI